MAPPRAAPVGHFRSRSEVRWKVRLHYCLWVSNSDRYKYFIRQTRRSLKIICLIKLTLIITLSSAAMGSLLILRFSGKY